MAQPPLSQQIRRLEAELGIELLRRTTRRVELAPAGELLLERARRILAAVDQAAVDCRRAAAGEFGRLSVGFTGSTTYALLPVVAKSLRDKLPGVELALHGEMLTAAQVEGLLNGTLDLALLRPPVRTHELSVEVIRTEPLIAALPSGHRLAGAEKVPVSELAEEPFVGFDPGLRSVLQTVVEEVCGAHGFQPRLVMWVTETSTLVSFVAAGVGVSLLPASVTGMSVTGAVYRPLAGEHPPRVQIALAWRRGDSSPVLSRALEIVQSTVMSHPADGFISHRSRL